MKRVAIWGLLVTLAAAAVHAAEPKPEEAVKKTIDTFVAAWNKHDSQAMAAVWAEDGDLINPFGEVAKGRAEVERVLQKEHTGPMKDTSFAAAVDAIRFVKPDVAVVDWKTSLDRMRSPDGALLGTHVQRVTVVLKQDKGKWWFWAARPGALEPKR